MYIFWGVLSEQWFVHYLKEKEWRGCFVGSTWKCFFYSTSCFRRPFVRSNCTALRVCVGQFLSVGQPWKRQEDIPHGLHHFLFFPKFPLSYFLSSFGLNGFAKIVSLLFVQEEAAFRGSSQRLNSLFAAADGKGSCSLDAGVHLCGCLSCGGHNNSNMKWKRTVIFFCLTLVCLICHVCTLSRK